MNLIERLNTIIGLSIIGLVLLSAILGLRELVSNLPSNLPFDFAPLAPFELLQSGAGE